MRKIVLLLVLFLSVFQLSAQTKNEPCETDALHLKLLNSDSNYKLNFDENNTKWQQYAPKHLDDWKTKSGKNGSVQTLSNTTLTVVFHDMQGVSSIPSGTPTSSLISANYSTIVSSMNYYFAGGNPGGINTYIQFCLAQQNEQGNAYTGLNTCHYTTITSLDRSDPTHIPTVIANSLSQNPLPSHFPTQKYINIYVVDDIKGSASGFATLPSAHGMDLDGIYIERRWLLATNPDDIKVLIHEMGHYLGLIHVFGICDPVFVACSCDNNNCLFDGDMVCDTPPSQQDFTVICTTTPAPNSCHTDAIPYPASGTGNVNTLTSDIPDAKNNYMDYTTDDSCRFNFTLGQVTRMHFMIDPIDGPRKSLLSNVSCTNCIAMDGCSFSITPSSNVVMSSSSHIYQLVQVSNATPSFSFSTAPLSCSSSTPTFVYTWNLVLLDTNTIIETYTSTNLNYFPTTTLLGVGNYQLQLSAVLNTSNNCIKYADVNFQIISTPDSCNLELPVNATNWGGWSRVAYTGGWSRNAITPHDFVYSGTTRTVVNSTHDGFDIISPSTLTNGVYDSNFTGVPMPAGATFTKVMRVGRKIDGVTQQVDGDAHYASVVFHPTKKNCKYRVYYLGVSNVSTSSPSGASVYYDNFNLHQNSLTSFGWLCQYNYTSPVTGTNSTIGMTENGYMLGNLVTSSSTCNHYGLNDMVFGKHHSDYSNTAMTTIDLVNYTKTTAWKYMDLDFSEFVDLNSEGLNTSVTLTFYSRTNDNSNASSHSYAYYAIECLGGGLPKDIDLNYPDILSGCQHSSTSCFNLSLPVPNYVIPSTDNSYMFPSHSYVDYYYTTYSGNFTSYQVETSSDDITYSPYITTTSPLFSILDSNFSYNRYLLQLCKTQSTSQFIYFKVTIKTLHKTLIKKFKYYNGFYNNAVCDPEPPFNGGLVPGGTNPEFVICLSNPSTLPTLTLTDPCLQPAPAGGYIYQWFYGNTNVGNQASLNLATLTPAQMSFLTNCKSTLVRKTSGIDPYCGTPIPLESQTYTAYNLTGQRIVYSKIPHDLCLRGQITVDISNFHIDSNDLGCIPSSLLPSGTFNNSVEVQLIAPAPSNTILATHTISYNPLNSTNYNFSLTVDNYNALTNSYVFSTIGLKQLRIRVIKNFYGCTTTVPDTTITFNILPTPLGGTITLNNYCNSTIDVISADVGISQGNFYQWEYSHDSSFPSGSTYIIPGQTDATITGMNISSFMPLPIYIRRKSFGYVTTICSNSVYSDNYITINTAPADPVFNFGTICKGTIAPALASTNGILGSWTLLGAPVTSIDTSVVGIFNYQFTPNSGQCTGSPNYIVPITITDTITPLFTPIAPVCFGSVSPLPNTSTNGITGTWSPAFDSNATHTYTFTPTSGVCPVAVTALVTVLPKANFSIGTNYCIGASAIGLPNHDLNGIVGTWTHNGTVVTQLDTSVIGSSDYYFTATLPNTLCEPFVLSVTIVSTTVTPTFSIPSQICYGNTAPLLPTTSLNGVVGTWSPSSISATASGNYVFTPNSNQCASSVTVSINVLTDCGISITWGSEVSCQLAMDPEHEIKDYDADIVDGPCIRVCENSTITYTLAGGTGVIDHTVWNITGGIVINDPALTNNTMCTITWGSASYCSLQGIIYLYNGTTLEINKCIEKLAPPNALFGIRPDFELITYVGCINSPVYFENLSTNNGGNDVLYYNWDFGDGTTSNEFEPNHTYTNTGNYVVTLQVYNGCSCSSSYQMHVKIVKNLFNIQCPSVACEGMRSTYNIESHLGDECPNLNWSVTGGHIVGHNGNNSEVYVVWDAVDADGYGYLSVQSPSCSQCVSQIKIPVVKQHGTIVGNATMCAYSQSTYSLPQWPTTDFQWSLDDGGTGATLIHNYNRNEIIVNALTNGTLVLHCVYVNTLLGCGGSADYTIHVHPFARLDGPTTVCQNVATTYQIYDENNTIIPTVSWTMDGPNGYVLTGTNGTFDITFPSIGNYNFTINDPAYCSKLKQIIVKEAPIAPTAITGPTVVCPGVPVTYSCVPLANAITHWEVVGGTILGSTTGNSISVNFDALPSTLTTYTIKVWYEGPICNSTELLVPIHRDVPVFNIQSNNMPTVCGSSFETYFTTYAAGENYMWTIEPETAGSVRSGQNSQQVVILWNQPNPTATIRLDIRKCGTVYRKTYAVTIIDSPDITIHSSNPLCSNQNFQPYITMSVGSAYSSITWDYGDGVVETLNSTQTPSHVYSNPPVGSISYDVVATVHGANGCLTDAVAHFPLVVSTSPVIDLNMPDMDNICGYENTLDHEFEASVNIQSGFSSTYVIQWYCDHGTGAGYVPLPAPYGNQAVVNFTDVAHGFGAGVYYASVTNVYNCTSTTTLIFIYDNCNPGQGPVGPPSPNTPCNCTYDFDVSYPCQGVVAQISNNSCTLVHTDWSYSPFDPNATITSYSDTDYSLDGLRPGRYRMSAYMTFDSNGTICYINRVTEFVVPYVADMRYNVTCGTGGNYSVRLIDHSVYYPQVGIAQYEFTTDGGLNWHAGSGPQTEYAVSLPPGNYVVGVRISSPGYTPCIFTTTLQLPAMPSAAFTFGTACQGTAMQFTASDTNTGLQYNWDFHDGSHNLQQNPVRTFANPGLNFVTLEVTNQYGCKVTSQLTVVNVIPVNMFGVLDKTPQITCVGTPLTIFYDTSGTVAPTQVTWYHNEVTSPPFAVTNNSMPNYLSLPVSQPGQYFVYLQDSNGCEYYETQPISVSFIPPPAPPVIQGNSVACTGSPINLSIPNDPSLHYVWYLNGEVQDSWADATSIHDTQSVADTYTYSVIAQVTSQGVTCSSSMATFEVKVVSEPDKPILELMVQSCDPYLVKVKVVNPQNGVNYYWSNGYTGLETQISHDGPIEVRAEIFDCSVTEQLDLPRDLTALAWEFPKGCYTFCKDAPMGYVIGPLGAFEEWSWIANGVHLMDGSGNLPSFTDLEPGNSYELFLYNGYCHTQLSSISIEEKDCTKCEMECVVKKVECITINGVTIYAVSLSVYNPYTDINAVLTVPGGEGYFANANVLLSHGLSTNTFVFYSLNGFMGGDVMVSMQCNWDAHECNRDLLIRFPKACPEVVDCQFKYEIKNVTCITTSYGSIYDVEVTVDNPYVIPALTQMTVPGGEGYFIPGSVQIAANGITTFHVEFYPLSGFGGGDVVVNFTTGFAAYNCTKAVRIHFPEACRVPDECMFEIGIDKPKCESLGGNQMDYLLTFSIGNPYGAAATITLTAPNGEGYFVPNILNLPLTPSTQVVHFYPLNGFHGGNVVVSMVGQWKDKICYREFNLLFEDCCILCPITDKGTAVVPLMSNLLRIAPNPAQERTTIFYNFANIDSKRTIEMVDLLGRTLQIWHPEESSGRIELDCSRYANGQYVILMKENDLVIENEKLLTH